MPATRTVQSEFEWDAAQQRYRHNGRFIKEREVARAVRTVIRDASKEITAVTRDMADGRVGLAEWQRRMAAEVKNLHVSAAMAARGGFRQMTPADYGRAGARLRREYAALRGFARDVKAGGLTRKQVIARARMYATGMNGTYEAARRAGAAGVYLEERSVLGATDRHCSSCIREAARGFVPVGTLTPIGERACLSNCLCRYVFRTRRQPANP